MFFLLYSGCLSEYFITLVLTASSGTDGLLNDEAEDRGGGVREPCALQVRVLYKIFSRNFRNFVKKNFSYFREIFYTTFLSFCEILLRFSRKKACKISHL